MSSLELYKELSIITEKNQVLKGGIICEEKNNKSNWVSDYYGNAGF